jgi:hypothetical protein
VDTRRRHPVLLFVALAPLSAHTHPSQLSRFSATATYSPFASLLHPTGAILPKENDDGLQ